MTCQEVVEFMQRDLDQDLTKEEVNQLHAHLHECAECADVYYKLTELSNDLSQLPKVNPPYSIVDHIMPQIEQLERQGEANASNVAEMSWGKRITRSLTTRTFGSLAAAAILLLVIVFSNDVPFSSSDEIHEASIANDIAQMNAEESDLVMTLTSEQTNDQYGAEMKHFSADDDKGMLRSQVFTASTNDEMPEHALEYYYDSPDQAYTAIVKNDELTYQIIIVNALGESIYQSSVFDADELNDLHWSEDGKQVHYEVVLNDAVSLLTISVD